MKLSEYLEPRGRTADLARRINCHQQLFARWASGERPVPAERCPDIERATAGQVSCEELTPTKPWHRIPDASWPHPGGRPVLDFAAAAKEAQQTTGQKDEITHE